MRMVCVTGMHRSGTSLLARVVNLLGVDLGPPRRLLPADAANPTGYWEDGRVVQLDDSLLGSLGGWWHQPPALPALWEYDWQLEPFLVWAAQLIADRYGPCGEEPGLTGFKDPRLSLLLPFWRRVVEVGPTFVAVRDPREVVASLVSRDGLDPELGAALWLTYTASAVVNAPGALALRYEDWLVDPIATSGRVATHLGVDAPPPAVEEQVRRFVDPALHRARPLGARPGRALGRALEVYDRIVTGPVAPLVGEMAELLS